MPEFTPGLVASIIVVTVLLASLFARRVPARQWLRYGAAWLAILGVLYVLFLFRDDMGTFVERVRADISGEPQIESGGSAITLTLSDGHFWATGATASGEQRFLVDSGATTTVLSARGAERLGVPVDSGFPVMVDTANGRTLMRRAEIERLTVGSISVVNLPVLVSDNGDDINVLGMNWLGRMASWRVEDNRMTIVPEAAAGE